MSHWGMKTILTKEIRNTIGTNIPNELYLASEFAKKATRNKNRFTHAEAPCFHEIQKQLWNLQNRFKISTWGGK